MDKILRFILLLIIFLIPIITPFQNFGYEKSKILFFIFLISLSGFLWIWFLHQQKIKLRWSAIKIISLIFIIILLLTSIFGIDPISSLAGKEPYFQGWIVYFYLWLFSLMISTIKISPSILIKVLGLSSVLVSFVALQHVGSTFGQPNFYSGFLLLTLPFIPRKGWWLFVIGLSMIAIFLSGSRIAIIILLLILIWWFLIKLKNYYKFFLIPIIVLVLLFFLLTMQQVLQTIYQQEVSSPERRYYIWPVMEEITKENFFRGIGLENIDVSWSNFFKKINWNSNRISGDYNPFIYSLKDLNVDRSHNSLLDVLLFSGVIGLLGYISLIGVMFKKIRSKILFSSLLIYLVWTQFQNQSIVHLMYFWLLVGLIDQNST